MICNNWSDLYHEEQAESLEIDVLYGIFSLMLMTDMISCFEMFSEKSSNYDVM